MTEPAPAISFAIPYYDNPGYLMEAVDSVRNQTITDWELIVVDDAGPAEARAAVESLGDPRITYVRNDVNLGLARNWNECVRRSRAPLVTVLHGDDRLMPNYAARVMEAARRHGDVAAVFTDVSIIGADGAPTWTMADLAKRLVRRRKHDHDLAGDRDLAGLLTGNYIWCPSMVLRKSVIGEAPFDPSWQFVPDLDFTVRVLAGGGRLHSIRTPLVQYRRHAASQTSVLTGDASRFDEELAFARRMASEMAAQGWQRSARAARRRVLLRLHMALRVTVDLLGRRMPPARATWRLLWRDLRPHGRDR